MERERTRTIAVYVLAFAVGTAVAFGLNLWWDGGSWQHALRSALITMAGAMIALALYNMWHARRRV